jgi:hypothetical protein
MMVKTTYYHQATQFQNQRASSFNFCLPPGVGDDPSGKHVVKVVLLCEPTENLALEMSCKGIL